MKVRIMKIYSVFCSFLIIIFLCQGKNIKVMANSGIEELKVSNSFVDTTNTTAISNRITIKNNSDITFDCTKLEIINIYKVDSVNTNVNVFCDNAAVQYNKSPWYASMTSSVIGNATCDSGVVTCRLTFSGGSIESEGQFSCENRIAKANWSNFSNVSLINTKILYDNKVIYSSLPCSVKIALINDGSVDYTGEPLEIGQIINIDKENIEDTNYTYQYSENEGLTWNSGLPLAVGEYRIIVEAEGISSNPVNIKITDPIQNIYASKGVTTYETGSSIDTADISLTVEYVNGQIENITDFTTNADEIDTSSEGTKQLTVQYNYKGLVKSCNLALEIVEGETKTPTSQGEESLETNVTTKTTISNSSVENTVAKEPNVQNQPSTGDANLLFIVLLGICSCALFVLTNKLKKYKR